MRFNLNEKGISLVEVVASIVIIGLIFFGFYSFFVTSKKISVSSEKNVDATYIAQNSMEELYNLLKTVSISELKNVYSENKSNFTSTYSEANNKNFNFKFDSDINKYQIEIQFQKIDKRMNDNSNLPSSINLYNIKVIVYENNVTKTTMQNIYSIKL